MNRIDIPSTFPEDRVSRTSGERLRSLIIESASKGPVTIDFQGVRIASTSFLDEGIAKLADEGWSFEKARKEVLLKGIDSFDLQILNQLAADRWKKKGMRFEAI